MNEPADKAALSDASVLSDHVVPASHLKDPSRYRADYGAPFSMFLVACVLVPTLVVLLLGAFALAIGPYGLVVLLMKWLTDR